MAVKKRYLTTKYGTRIDVTGLTSAQIAQVKSMAEGGGAYGGKGANLAKTLQQKNAAASQGSTSATPAAAAQPVSPYAGNPLGIDAKSGDVDPAKATETIGNAEQQDFQTNFNTNNPGSQTDAFGNSQTVTRDPVTGEVKIVQNAGANLTSAQGAFTNAATNWKNQGALDLSGAPQIDASGAGRQRAEDANYAYITKDYANRKAREVEDAKQELANRGIPLDPSPDSLYGRTLREIDNKYQALDDQAKNQAIMSGNQSFATDVSAQSAANSAFVNAALGQQSSNRADYQATAGVANSFNPTSFTPYQGADIDQSGNMQSALNSIAGFNAQKYATDKNYKAQMDQIAVQRLAASKRGGGGSKSSGDGGAGFIIAGEAP